MLIQLTKNKMKVYAQESGGKIIDQYMHGQNSFQIDDDKDFKIALFDKNQKLITSRFQPALFPTKEFEKIGNYYYLKDESAREHFGVKTIVVQEKTLKRLLQELLNSVILLCLIAIVLFFSVGVYLAKLFLRPIRSEIDRFDRFIANSAHELKTPISALILIADSLKDSCKDEKNLTRLKIVARSIAGIYDDLAFFSKKGDMESFDENIELSSLINQRVELLADLMRLKNISVELSLKTKWLKTDRSKFSRVIDNLLTNSIKFTPNGGKILITLNDKTVSIEDSGTGIADSIREKIFDRYFRAKSNQNGFGIGLAIVKSICDQYQINIKTETSMLGGAKFELTF